MSLSHPNHWGSLPKNVDSMDQFFHGSRSTGGGQESAFQGASGVTAMQPTQHCIETQRWWGCRGNMGHYSNQVRRFYKRDALVWNLAWIQPSFLLLTIFQRLPGATPHIRTRSLRAKGWNMTSPATLKQPSCVLTKTGDLPAGHLNSDH